MLVFVFLLIATFMSAFLCFIWSSDRFVNVTIKIYLALQLVYFVFTTYNNNVFQSLL